MCESYLNSILVKCILPPILNIVIYICFTENLYKTNIKVRLSIVVNREFESFGSVEYSIRDSSSWPSYENN